MKNELLKNLLITGSLTLNSASCTPPQSLPASTSSSASPTKKEPQPTATQPKEGALIYNENSELLCAVQVVGQGSVSGSIDITNTCESIVSPDQIRFSSSEVEKLVALAHSLLSNDQCAKSLEIYQQAYARESSFIAKGYISNRIEQVRQCTSKLLQFGSRMIFSADRIVEKEKAEDYQLTIQTDGQQEKLVIEAQQAMLNRECQLAVQLYDRILSGLSADSAFQRFVNLQKTFAQGCEKSEIIKPLPIPSLVLSSSPIPAASLAAPTLLPSVVPPISPIGNTATPSPTAQPTSQNSPLPSVAISASPSDFVNTLGMHFRYIAPGSFTMGQIGISDANPTHSVSLSKGFYLQTTELTQKQWLAIMGNFPGSSSGITPTVNYGLGDNYPMYRVSWHDVHSYLGVLNDKGEGKYRLPTEAEWEYAARAGSVGDFSCDLQAGLCPSDYAWTFSSGFSTPSIKQVASFSPNPWGLYDMHGNVSEWVSDWFEAYSEISLVDPQGPPSSDSKVTRGGSWTSTANSARSASRVASNPLSRHPAIGFRLIYEP